MIKALITQSTQKSLKLDIRNRGGPVGKVIREPCRVNVVSPQSWNSGQKKARQHQTQRQGEEKKQKTLGKDVQGCGFLINEDDIVPQGLLHYIIVKLGLKQNEANPQVKVFLKWLNNNHFEKNRIPFQQCDWNFDQRTASLL